MASLNGKSLAVCAPNEMVEITRVIDQEPEFLQFVNRRRLTPGVSVIVERRDDVAQVVQVRVEKAKPTTLGLGVAAKILVEPI